MTTSMDEIEQARAIFKAQYDGPNVLGTGISSLQVIDKVPLRNEGADRDLCLLVLLLDEPDERLPDFIDQVPVRYRVTGEIVARAEG